MRVFLCRPDSSDRTQSTRFRPAGRLDPASRDVRQPCYNEATGAPSGIAISAGRYQAPIVPAFGRYHCTICGALGGTRTPTILLTATSRPVSYTHLRAHETRHDLVCRLLLEKKK